MGHFQPTSASAGCSGFWLFSAWPSSPWASLKLKQRQLPIQRLILIFFMEATTTLDIIMEATMATLTTDTTARDLLTLSLLLLLTPRLKLTPGMDIMVDMVSDTMVDTTVDTMAAPAPTADAKADPWVVYGHYGLGGYYGYGGYYGGYPYYGYYGKRSADAEPAPAPTADAKADPWY